MSAWRPFARRPPRSPVRNEVINLPAEPFLDHAWPVVVMVPMEADSRIWRNLYGYEIDGITEISAAAYPRGTQRRHARCVLSRLRN